MSIQFTQGDTATLQLTAHDGNGGIVDVTGASFETQIVGQNGVVAVFPNSQHTIIDSPNGLFGLTLSEADTVNCGAGAGKDVVTKISQGSSVIHFRGVGILTVLPSTPRQ